MENSKLLDIPGLVYQEIPGDGHCLFHAVGLYIGQDQQTLRNIVAAYIENNIEQFREFTDLPEDQTVENYIEAIRTGKEWADHLEIEVLMRVLNRPIVVITTNGIIGDIKDLDRFQSEPIFVYYNGYDHYNAFLREDGYSDQAILEHLKKNTKNPCSSLTSSAVTHKKNEPQKFSNEKYISSSSISKKKSITPTKNISVKNAKEIKISSSSNKAVKLRNKNNTNFYQEGLNSFERKQYQESLIKFKLAYDDKKEDTDLLVKLTQTLYSLGEYRESLKYHRLLIKNNGNSSYIYFNYAKVLFKLESYEKALEKLDKAMSLSLGNITECKKHLKLRKQILDKSLKAKNPSFLITKPAQPDSLKLKNPVEQVSLSNSNKITSNQYLFHSRKNNSSSLAIAMKNSDIDKIKFLLKSYKENYNNIDSKVSTKYLAGYYGNQEIIQIIIDHENCYYRPLNTYMVLGVSSVLLASMIYTLERYNKYGISTATVFVSFFLVLIASNSLHHIYNRNNFNLDIRSILRGAIDAGRVDVIRWLHKYHPKTFAQCDSEGFYSSHTIVLTEHISVVEYFIASNLFDLNVRTREKGYTPFLLAVACGTSTIVKLLLEKFPQLIEIEQVNNKGQKAIEIANLRRQDDIINILNAANKIEISTDITIPKLGETRRIDELFCEPLAQILYECYETSRVLLRGDARPNQSVAEAFFEKATTGSIAAIGAIKSIPASNYVIPSGIEFIPLLPDLLKYAFSYINNTSAREVASYIANLVSPDRAYSLFKEVSIKIANDYENQIKQLNREGITHLAKCAATRIINYVGSDEGKKSTFFNNVKSTIIEFAKKNFFDKSVGSTPVRKKLLKGLVYGTHGDLYDKLRHENNMINDNNPWVASELFTIPIQTNEGEIFILPTSTFKVHKYGYRKGNTEDILTLDYQLYTECNKKFLI